MSTQKPPKAIDVKHVIVDRENPRHPEPADSELSAITSLLKIAGAEILALARDISEYGVSPFEFPMVFRADHGNYVVTEGNRRITAIKVILNPDLAAAASESLRTAFSEIKASNKRSFSEIMCTVMESRESCIRWMDLKHTGLNGGRGVLPWGATEKARFAARYSTNGNRNIFAVNVIDLVKAKGGLTPAQEKQVDEIKITNLERVLGDPHVRNALGVKRSKDGVMMLVEDEKPVVAALKKVVLDIADPSMKVSDIFTTDQRKAYVEKLPDKFKPGYSVAPASPSLIRLAAKAGESKNETRKRYSPRSPDDRAALVPASSKVQVGNPRLRRILIQLKRLDVDAFGDAVAVLLRVFLELSIEDFLTANHVPFHENAKLRDKMGKVADYWQKVGTFTDRQLTQWRNALSTHELFSINVLHSYVHHSNAVPRKKDLIRTWDQMETYIVALWDQR